MSFLHLLRHANAGDPEAWTGPDSERPLSTKGRGQALRLGRHLGAIGFAPGAIISSPKVRAVETARLVGGVLDVTVVIDDRLGGSLDLATVEAILTDHGDPDDPILVGHDPDCSELLAVLGGTDVPMRKGALARLDVERPLAAGGGTLRWLLPPDALGPGR